MKPKEKNIYDVAKPFYIVLNMFGLACFKIDRNSRVLVTTALNKCLFAAFLVLWGLMNILHRNVVFESGAKSNLLDDLRGYQYKLQHYFGVLVLVYNFAQRKHVESLLKSLDNFDRFSRVFGSGFKPRFTHVIATIAFLVFLLTILLLHTVETCIMFPQFTVIQHIVYVQIMMFFLVVTQQFTISVNSVSIRLTHFIVSFE